jgi:hypothetical protein
VHAPGTLQLWFAKLGKVFSEAWGQVVRPAGRTGSSTAPQGLLLSNGAMKPPCLTPQTIYFRPLHNLRKRRRHQMAPGDVNKSDNGACVRASKGQTGLEDVDIMAYDE